MQVCPSRSCGAYIRQRGQHASSVERCKRGSTCHGVHYSLCDLVKGKQHAVLLRLVLERIVQPDSIEHERPQRAIKAHGKIPPSLCCSALTGHTPSAQGMRGWGLASAGPKVAASSSHAA